MKTAAFLALAMVALAPADADAQRRWAGHDYNKFSFEPYAGAFMDAYDLEPDDSNLGWIAGLRAGYQAARRVNLHVNLGYASTGDVATRPLPTDPIYDNQWIMLTGGADFALVPGNTSVALGADFGVAWRRTRADDPLPDAGFDDDGWAAYPVVVPGFVVRHQFTPRAGVFGSVQDYIFDVFDGTAQHSPAFTAGLSFR